MTNSTMSMYDEDFENSGSELKVYFYFKDKEPTAITFAANASEAVKVFKSEYPDVQRSDISEQYIAKNQLYRFKSA